MLSRLAALAAGSAIALTACGDRGSFDASRCVSVDQEVQQWIADRLTASGRATLGPMMGYRSDDYEKVYMVAGVITAPGMSAPGVWATNDVDELSATFAVDGIAREFSRVPCGEHLDLGPTSHGVRQVRECL